MDERSGAGDASPQPPFIVEPTSRHTYSLILLHGLGSNGHKFGSELIQSATCSNGNKLTDILPGARFIFPTSRRRRSSAFNRAILNQWFDMEALGESANGSERQLRGLGESYKEILELLSQEVEKVSRENVILGGLSQGCAMSLISLLAVDFPVGGFIGMSGRLPFGDDIHDIAITEDGEDDEDNPFDTGEDKKPEDPISMVQRYVRHLLSVDDQEQPSQERSSIQTPIFLGHGALDEKVLPSRGEKAYQTLKTIGFRAEWRCYADLGHWYKIPDEIEDIVEFVKASVGWDIENDKRKEEPPAAP